jgi:hypothetical protein
MARVTIELDSLEEAEAWFGARAWAKDHLAIENWLKTKVADEVQAPSEERAALGLAESVEPLSVPGAGAAYTVSVAPEPLVLNVPPPPPADDIDSAGVVWDAAVHSANRTKNADGTWRKRRGVETAVPPPPPAADSAAVPPAPVTAAPNWPATVQELMPLVTRAMVAGTLTPAAIGEACRSVGITALPDLATRPELIPAMCAALGVVS